MPILSKMRTEIPRRSTILGLIAALSIFASACSSSPSELTVSANQLPAAPTSLNDVLAEPGAHQPQFGDSLRDFYDASPSAANAAASVPPPDGYVEVEWEDLIPEGSSRAEISARFDERIAEVEPGSPEADAVFADLQAEFGNQPANPAIADQDILLAGFIAPLTYSGDLITEFLLVPYFGACIHVPPPPPNQTVMVSLAEGDSLTIEDSWGAVWVTGTITIESADTDLAPAFYTISEAQSGAYSAY